MEDAAVMGGRRHRRQRDPPGRRAPHGKARRRADHRGRRVALDRALAAERRCRADPHRRGGHIGRPERHLVKPAWPAGDVPPRSSRARGAQIHRCSSGRSERLRSAAPGDRKGRRASAVLERRPTIASRDSTCSPYAAGPAASEERLGGSSRSAAGAHQSGGAAGAGAGCQAAYRRRNQSTVRLTAAR